MRIALMPVQSITFAIPLSGNGLPTAPMMLPTLGSSISLANMTDDVVFVRVGMQSKEAGVPTIERPRRCAVLGPGAQGQFSIPREPNQFISAISAKGTGVVYVSVGDGA